MLISHLPSDLCLSFANTRFWRGRPAPSETLHDCAELLAWLQGAGTEGLASATDWSHHHPHKAQQVFAEAVQVREALYDIFSVLADEQPVRQSALAVLQQALSAAPARHALVRSGKAFAWRIDETPVTAPALLAPVLWSAADLLVGDLRYAVRRCANDECVWLFLDRSKAGTRRWCDMASCGNRAKARRHYSRIKHAHA
jgi:predicted RNA-binding Zn ribbon-like protein